MDVVHSPCVGTKVITMAEPAQANAADADAETGAETGAWEDGGATAVVDDVPTSAGPELAWSDAGSAIAPEPGDAGRQPLPRSLTFLLGGVCVGALVLGAFVIGQHQMSRRTAPAAGVASVQPTPAPITTTVAVVPSPAPAAAPTPVPSATTATVGASPLPDAYRAGLASTNPGLSAFVCRYLGSPDEPHAGAAAQQLETRTGWGFERSFEFVVSAIVDDCPQYGDR